MSSLLLAALCALSVSGATDRPIIGIFSHRSHSENCGSSGICDLIEASYVKWVESAGGRAVPIPYAASNHTIDTLFSGLNGALLPGGGTGIDSSAQYLYDKVVKANEDGDYFPLWGTCLGYEWILQAAGGPGVLDGGFDAENITLPLNFTTAATTSRLYSDSNLRKLFAENPIAMNNHKAGIEPRHMAIHKGLVPFQVLSTNVDRHGRLFVSSIEHNKLPIYGVQYHPEKNNFEYGYTSTGRPYEVINHSPEAVRASQGLANFLIDEARKSNHKFQPEELDKVLMYNYPVTKTGPEFVQTYYMHF